MTPVEISNLALGASGNRHTIASLTETSREAEECDRWYASVRDQVLCAAFWAGATAHMRLSVVSTRDVDLNWTNTDPDPGWAFAYAAPPNMLRPRYLSDFSRFKLSSGMDNSALIMAQAETPVLTYTKRQVEVDAWDANLRMAIVYSLAASICTPLKGTLDQAQLLAQQAQILVADARANDANVDEAQYETTPPWIQARGHGTPSIPSRFYYPYGPMIAVTEGVGVT